MFVYWIGMLAIIGLLDLTNPRVPIIYTYVKGIIA